MEIHILQNSYIASAPISFKCKDMTALIELVNFQRRGGESEFKQALFLVMTDCRSLMQSVGVEGEGRQRR